MTYKIHKTKTQDHLGNHRANRKITREICNNTVDHRIPGVPLSAVEQQHTTRVNKVKRLIDKFENHKNKDSLIQDLRQTEKINKFSTESQKLDRRHEQHRDLRILRKFFQTAMSWLQFLLGNWNYRFAAVEEKWSLRGVQREFDQ